MKTDGTHPINWRELKSLEYTFHPLSGTEEGLSNPLKLGCNYTSDISGHGPRLFKSSTTGFLFSAPSRIFIQKPDDYTYVLTLVSTFPDTH